MSKKERKEKRKGRFGAFFGGGFLGFNLCLLLIAGTLCFTYFKVSPNWINKTFKTSIDLGSDEVNSKTLNDVVKIVKGISENTDTYTLKNLQDDFGLNIKDEMFGINIKDIKGVALTEIGSAVEKKFATISADELRKVNGMNLEGEMGHVLDMNNTYYFNPGNNKLFEDDEYTTEVGFEYVISADKQTVTTKGHDSIVKPDNKVEIQLWYLPLSSALGDFTSSMGDNLTLKELEEFGVTLPNFMNNERVNKETTTVNQLQTAIDNLYVGDILGYTIDDSDIDNIIVKDGGTTITGINATIAKFKVSGLKDGVDGLQLKDVFTTDDLSKGALSLIPATTKITNIASTLNTRFETVTLGEMVDAQVVKLDASGQMIYNSKKDMYVQGTNILVRNLPISQMVTLSLNHIPTSSTPTN